MVNLDHARELFREYAAQPRIDLCVQDFTREVDMLPGEYAPPRGRLHIHYEDDCPAASVALRPFSESIGELKRLYVRPAFRNRGLGRRLVELMIEESRSIGYKAVQLDTLVFMHEAIALYKKMGFQEIPPYRSSGRSELVYFEYKLWKSKC